MTYLKLIEKIPEHLHILCIYLYFSPLLTYVYVTLHIRIYVKFKTRQEELSPYSIRYIAYLHNLAQGILLLAFFSQQKNVQVTT